MPAEITKTGPKYLKGIRNSDLYQNTIDWSPEELERIAQESARAKMNYYRANAGFIGSEGWHNPGVYSPQPVGEEDPRYSYGTSTYDETLGNLQAGDIQDQRAERQGALTQLGAGVAKFAGLTATTFIGGTAGLLYGLGSIGFQGGKFSAMFNNEVANTLHSINEAMENILPNYRSQQEEQGPWYNNLDTMNFWADGLLKNMGFTAGAVAVGTLVAPMLGALGLGVGGTILTSLISAVGEGIVEANNTYHDLTNLEQQKLADASTKAVDAILARDDISTEQKDALLAEHYKRVDALSQDIEDKALNAGVATLAANTAFLTLDNWYTWGKLFKRGTKNATNIATSQVGQESRQAVANAAEKGATKKAAEETAETAGKVEAKAGKTAAEKEGAETATSTAGEEPDVNFVPKKRVGNAAEQMAEEDAKKEFTSRVAGGDNEPLTWKDITKTQAVLKGLKKGLVEGHEEIAQAFISEWSGNSRFMYDDPDAYYHAIVDPKGKEMAVNQLTALTNSFANTYMNGDKYEEFAVGFLTGILGSPTFGRTMNNHSTTYLGKGSIVGMSGGILGELSDAKRQNLEGRTAVQSVNSYEEKLKELEDEANIRGRYFMQTVSFTNSMDGWAAENDEFEYRNARDSRDLSIIASYAKLGKLDRLKTLVSRDFENMSDEELDSIAKQTTYEGQSLNGEETKPGTGWRNADGSYMSDTQEGRDAMRQELSKRRDKILKQIEEYEDSVETVRQMAANSIPDEYLEELVWLHWKGKQFDNRYAEIKGKINPKLSSLVSDITELRDVYAEEGTQIQDTDNKWDLQVKRLRKQLSQAKRNAKRVTSEKKKVEYQQKVSELEEDLAAAEEEKKKEDKIIAEGGNTLKAENEEEVKHLNGLINFLSLLQKKEWVAGLYSYVKANPRLGEFLLSRDFYNIYSNHGGQMNSSSWEELMRDLADISRMSKAAFQFNQRLDEYKRDPLAIAKKRQEIDNKQEDEQKAKEVLDKRKKLSEMTNDELAEAIQNGEIDPADFMNDATQGDLPGSNSGSSTGNSNTSKGEEVAGQTPDQESKVPESVFQAAESGSEPPAGVMAAGEAADKQRVEAVNKLGKLREELKKNTPDGIQNATTARDIKTLFVNTYNRALSDLTPDIVLDPNAYSLDDFIKSNSDEVQALKDSGAADAEIRERFAARYNNAMDIIRQVINKVNNDNQDTANFPTTAPEQGDDTAEQVGKDGPTSTPPVNGVYDGKKKEEGPQLNTPTEAIATVVQAIIDDFEETTGTTSSNTLKNNLLELFNGIAESLDKGTSIDGIKKVLKSKELYDILDTVGIDLTQYAEDFANGKYDTKATTEEEEDKTREEKDPDDITTPTITKEDLEKEGDPQPDEGTQPSKNLNFWANTTRPQAYHPLKGDTRPYYQIAQQALNKGDTRYTQADIDRMEAVHQWMADHGAFTKQLTGIPNRTKIHFVVSPELNAKAKQFIILLADEKGNILGDLMPESDGAQQNQIGLSDFYKRVRAEYEKAQWGAEKGMFDFTNVSGISSEVAASMIGYVNYTQREAGKEDPTLNEIAGQEPVRIGIMRRGSLWDSTGSRMIMTPKTSKPGQPFLLIRTAGGRLFPVPFHMPLIKDATNSKLYSNLKLVIREIVEAKSPSQDSVFELKDRIMRLLAVKSIKIGYDKKSGTLVAVSAITEGGDKIKLYGKTNLSSVDEIVNQIMDNIAQNNLGFQISRELLGGQLNGEDYNAIIGEIARTNLPVGQPLHTVNDWFIINPIGPDGKMIAASRPVYTGNPTPATKPTEKPEVFNYSIGGTTYRYNPSEDTVYKIEGNTLLPITDNSIKGLAWGMHEAAKQGIDITKPFYLTIKGVKYFFDPANVKITKEQKVTRPSTTTSTQQATQSQPSGRTPIALSADTFTQEEAKLIYEATKYDKNKPLVPSIDPSTGVLTYQSKATTGNKYVATFLLTDGELQSAETLLSELNKIRNLTDAESEKQRKELYKKIGALRGRVRNRIKAEINAGNTSSVIAGIINGERKTRILGTSRVVNTASKTITLANGSIAALSDPSHKDLLDKITKIVQGSTDFTYVYQELQKLIDLPFDEWANLEPYIKSGNSQAVIDFLLTGKLGNTPVEQPHTSTVASTAAPTTTPAGTSATTKQEGETTKIEPPQKPTDAEISEAKDLERDAKKKGLFIGLKAKKGKAVWQALTAEQQSALLDRADADIKRVWDKLCSAATVKGKAVTFDLSKYNANTIDELINSTSNTDSSALRATDSEHKTQSVADAAKDIEKESKWLAEALPQFNTSDRLRVIQGLIRVRNSKDPITAWGQFLRGIITLSDRMAAGTLYHESFHAVIRTLMTNREIEETFRQAKTLYGDLSRMELEERMAEGFRKYMQLNYNSNLGFFARLWRRIKHFVSNLFGRQPYMQKLFYDIYNGKFKDRAIQEDNNSTAYRTTTFFSDIMQESDPIKERRMITQYHRDSLMYGNLTQEQRDQMQARGLTMEEYNRMSDFEKENILYCL